MNSHISKKEQIKLTEFHAMVREVLDRIENIMDENPRAAENLLMRLIAVIYPQSKS